MSWHVKERSITGPTQPTCWNSKSANTDTASCRFFFSPSLDLGSFFACFFLLNTMCSRDLYSLPPWPCHKFGSTGCPTMLSLKPVYCNDLNPPPVPRLHCPPGPRQCRPMAPCDPRRRPCSPCRACCPPGKAPPPCAPYGPRCPFDNCGMCVPIAKHDRWTWAWS